MTKRKELREGTAKWLASVIENGEPYDDFATMDWSEFASGERGAEAFRELADMLFVYQTTQGIAIVTFPPRGSDLTDCAIVKVEPLIKERKKGHKRSS